MYRNIDDFLNDWNDEEKFTEKFFGLIKEESKKTKVHEDVRSLERLAWHITQTLTEMPTKAGLFDHDPLHDMPAPHSIDEIIKINKKYSKELVENIKTKWKNEDLENEVNMYGDNWKKGKILSILIGHQVHHRGQMTVIMRLLNIPVLGYFGPSKEEWIAMGVPAME